MDRQSKQKVNSLKTSGLWSWICSGWLGADSITKKGFVPNSKVKAKWQKWDDYLYSLAHQFSSCLNTFKPSHQKLPKQRFFGSSNTRSISSLITTSGSQQSRYYPDFGAATSWTGYPKHWQKHNGARVLTQYYWVYVASGATCHIA